MPDLDDDDDRPRRRKIAKAVDGDDADEPVRPKKKKKKPRVRTDDEDDAARERQWRQVPIVLIIVGLVLTLIGTVGIALKAKTGEQSVGVVIVVVMTLVQMAISIPITIAALYFGGQIMGIEYGSMSRAFLGIAAIYCMVMGLDWVLSMIGLWPIVIIVATSVVAFGLFMTLFELDTWEVWASIVCIRIFATGVNIAFYALVLGMAKGALR
jgi:hypothetical protein